MEINSSIFKAYDIRGIYPEEINQETAFRIASAFVLFLKKKQKNRWKKIVVSRDNRLSSPELHKAVVRGIIAAGAEVIDIGLATTPMFYFAVAHYGFDGGIQVSASHNPPKYNGLKIVREKAIPVGGESGLSKIREIISHLQVGISKKHSEVFNDIRMISGIRERLTHKNVLRDYLNFQFKDFRIKVLKPSLKHLRLVADTANAVSGPVVAKFMDKIGVDFIHLNSELDGRFPSHLPDPLRLENLKQLRAGIKNYKADLGVAFDGDGDRIIFCDEKGNPISSDIITALIATIVLRENPGAKIAYDIRSSRATEEAIKESGGIPKITRVGHSFIKQRMREENIIFAGEFSGHFYHREHYFCESPLWVLLCVLQEIVNTGRPLSKIVSPWMRYFSSGELNFEIEDKKKIVERLKHKFRRGKLSEMDGIRIDFKDWWFLARPSNTEDVLRVSLEAKTKDLLEKQKKKLTQLIMAA